MTVRTAGYRLTVTCHEDDSTTVTLSPRSGSTNTIRLSPFHTAVLMEALGERRGMVIDREWVSPLAVPDQGAGE